MPSLRWPESFKYGLWVQGLLTVPGGLIVAAQWGAEAGWAVGLGAATAMLGSGVLIWRWWKTGQVVRSDPAWHLKVFYRVMMMRYAVVGILLGGALWGGVSAAALLAGFVSGQVGWTLATLLQRKKV